MLSYLISFFIPYNMHLNQYLSKYHHHDKTVSIDAFSDKINYLVTFYFLALLLIYNFG